MQRNVDLVVASSAGTVTICRGWGRRNRRGSADRGQTRTGSPAADFNGDASRSRRHVRRHAEAICVVREHDTGPQQPPPVQTPTPNPHSDAAAAGARRRAQRERDAREGHGQGQAAGQQELRRPVAGAAVAGRDDGRHPQGHGGDLAAGHGGTAKFFDGIFKISQTKGKRPLTTLTLTEKLSCPKGKKATASAAKKKSRKLWGDGKGTFRTSGKYSAATVRGTKWLVTDRCDSTTTKVTQGSVNVRDFVKKRNKVVRDGKSYTARKR